MLIGTLLLQSIPLAVELRTDYIRIMRDKKRDNHGADLWARGGLIVCMSVLCSLDFKTGLSWREMIQSILLGTSWFWLWFDYILNYAINEPILSLGTTSWLDKKIRSWPWWFVLFLKVAFFTASLLLYFEWDWIFHGYDFAHAQIFNA